MSVNSKIMDAIAELKVQNVELKDQINELKELILSQQKQVSTKNVEPAMDKLTLKKAELEAVQKSTKMKPDAKEKKIEKLNEQIKKLEEKSKPVEKPKQNLPRISPKIIETLKEVIGSKYTDSMKDEFKTYVNEMSSDTYAAHDMKIHMENFKNLQTPSGGGGGGGGEHTSVPTILTIKELHKLQDKLTKHADEAGVYLDSDGKHVTGPVKDENEDLDEKEFDGQTFLVGEETQRVYHNETEEFLGFWRTKGGLI